MIEEVLKELNITYEEVKHQAVYTSEEALFIKDLIKGVGCKNLFLTNHHNKFYLVFMGDTHQCNIKSIKKITQEKNLSFASEEELENILKIKRGSVTPMALINDNAKLVTVIIDNSLKDNYVLCHLYDNTSTISIELEDLIKYIKYTNHEVLFYDE